MNTVQGNLVPIELSFDNGVSWQVLVCLKQWNMPLTRATTVTDTFCGPAVGLGNMAFNPTGEAVCTTDAAAGSQVTVTRLIAAMKAGETFQFRCYHPGSGSVGSLFYLRGNCKATDINILFPAVDITSFTWTLTGEGTLTTTAP
jgi:hypothetical protein